jgi:poly(3-hydroxybutyrate) depolymerase
MRGRRSPWSLLRLAEQKASRGPPMYFGRQHSFAAATPGLVSDEAAVRRGDDAIQDGVRRATLLVAIALLVATVAAPVTPRSRLGTSADVSFAYEDGSVLVHLPAHAARIGVIVLHSFGHTAAEPASQGWSTAADRHRFVALYPERGTSWNAGLCCGSAADEQRDDVSWLAGAITLAQTKYHLQTIYLVGFSNGGMMVERLVAERPELSDRFAVWGAAPEMPTGGRWTGTGSLFEGRDDLLVPRTGGVVTFDGETHNFRPASETQSYLIGARLKTFVVSGLGHAPPPSWPEMAWNALTQTH